LGYLNPPPAPAPVVVYKDVGGLVSQYQAQTEIYRREGREVRLHECRSACTLALSLPNACVYPHSILKFHQAYNALNREVDLGVSAILFTSYPAAVQARLGDLTREYRILTGSELIALGIKNCNGDGRTIVASRKPLAPPRDAAGVNPLTEIAQSVQTAVAGALQRPNDAPTQPIRVAVADRTATIARLASSTIEKNAKYDASGAGTAKESLDWAAKMPGDVRLEAGYGEAPTPPRRPPSIAFTAQERLPPLAYAQLIHGAQPIISNTQFVSGDVSFQ
jgi:hypothetical protein